MLNVERRGGNGEYLVAATPAGVPSGILKGLLNHAEVVVAKLSRFFGKKIMVRPETLEAAGIPLSANGRKPPSRDA